MYVSVIAAYSCGQVNGTALIER